MWLNTVFSCTFVLFPALSLGFLTQMFVLPALACFWGWRVVNALLRQEAWRSDVLQRASGWLLVFAFFALLKGGKPSPVEMEMKVFNLVMGLVCSRMGFFFQCPLIILRPSSKTFALFFLVNSLHFYLLWDRVLLIPPPFSIPSMQCKNVISPMASLLPNFIVTAGPLSPHLLGAVLGYIIALYTSKRTTYELRNRLVWWPWSNVHNVIDDNKLRKLPHPDQRAKKQTLINLVSFNTIHPNASPLCIPVPRKVSTMYDHAEEWILSFVAPFPVAVVTDHPDNKPRVHPRSAIDDYWNSGSKLRPQTPKGMVRYAYEGELLSYVLLHSHGFRDVRLPTDSERYAVRKATGEAPNRVLDYTKYERFENREGYSPYGGKAFFEAVNADGLPCMLENGEICDFKLIGVIAARDTAQTIVKTVGPSPCESVKRAEIPG